MKKIAFIIGLLALSLVVIACAPRPADDESALAGEAVRAAGGQNLVFVDNARLWSFFPNRGNDQWATALSGKELCKDLGYKGCFAAEWSREDRYFTTNDRSCSGQHQYIDSNSYWVDCAFFHPASPCSQVTVDNNNAVEPYLGDVQQVMRVDSLICTK